MRIKQINKNVGVGAKKGLEFCIYTDTDSLFYSTQPLFELEHGSIQNHSEEFIVEKSLEIVDTVQKIINDSYTKYAKSFHNVDTHGWNIKQELLASRGFWTGNIRKTKGKSELIGVKKRYALKIVNEKGNPKQKLEIKGLDVVRSSFPPTFKKEMTTILELILNDASKSELNERIRQFKQKLDNTSIIDIGMISGTNDITKYISTTNTSIGNNYVLKAPAHVKAAINYNTMLDLIKDTDSERINDGDKIIWFYLKKNPYNLESMAIRGYNDNTKVIEFINTYIDRDQIFESVFINKLTNFWHSLGWGDVELNTMSKTFFSF